MLKARAPCRPGGGPWCSAGTGGEPMTWLRVGAVLGFLAVGMGAFGAHGLRGKLEALGTAASFQTAAQYQMYHALALVAVGLLAAPGRPGPAAALAVAGWAFLVGVLLF